MQGSLTITRHSLRRLRERSIAVTRSAIGRDLKLEVAVTMHHGRSADAISDGKRQTQTLRLGYIANDIWRMCR